jgi:hypothetical protein
MEYFVCPCSATGQVILDGQDRGPNKNPQGDLLAKQCSAGRHTLALQFPNGRACIPPQVTLTIRDTDPVLPQEIPFDCTE